mmetsp:Transcript_2984/g.5509  ORF Transcript_2984/g.5509 Transcript_2984/m.5509 type:complete len:357 (+) Transcript_2984:192-1262(+)
MWHHLYELANTCVPIVKHCLSNIASGSLDVLLNVSVHFPFLLFSINGLESDKTHVASCRELAIRIVDVSDTTTHSCCVVATCFTKTHNNTTRHVFRSMVTNSFDDCKRTGVPDAKAFSSLSTEETLSSSGSVKAYVADNDMLGGVEATSYDLGTRVNSNLATRETFSSVVVRITFHIDGNALGKSEPERLTCMTFQVELDGVIRETFLTKSLGNFIREHGSESTIDIRTLSVDHNRSLGLERFLCSFDEFIILCFVESVILSSKITDSSRRIQLGCGSQQWAEIESSTLVVKTSTVYLEMLCLSNHLFHGLVAKLRHDFSDFLSHQEEIVHHVLRLSRELATELLVLCGDTNWTGI